MQTAQRLGIQTASGACHDQIGVLAGRGALELERQIDRIGALMTRFLHSVSFKAGDQPRYGELPALFSLHARLIRTSGPVPEISSDRSSRYRS